MTAAALDPLDGVAGLNGDRRRREVEAAISDLDLHGRSVHLQQGDEEKC